MSALKHPVLQTPIDADWPEGLQVAYFGMGCFWGAERLFWQTEGVYATAVGYQGGHVERPDYDAVCRESTGHAEVVRVVYDPARVDYEALLKVFWENHDPTQGMRQGNDVGSQYRSVIFTTTKPQLEAAQRSAAAFAPVVAAHGRGAITTHIGQAPQFWLAEDYHQQYLYWNPLGYCNHGPNGMSCPIGIK
ncbi:peptide-methionine (S)-S-oxide reductase MsrA [Natronoglycomyces albus]|nr:peptide-methionine (S)-S-oxide reductase MsrA [Natronoglycomyces albus]